jgi:phage N-6-adenine-methyltransferase
MKPDPAMRKAPLAIRSDAEAKALVARERAILEAVKTLPEARAVWHRARTLTAALKAARRHYGISKDTSDDAVGYRLDVERKFAELVADGQRKGEIYDETTGRPGKASPGMTLSEATGLARQNFAPIAMLGKLAEAAYAAALMKARAAGDLSRMAVLMAADAARLAPLWRSEAHDWQTPPDLFAVLDAEFAFTLDVCATADTALCPRYFTPEEDGLVQPWAGRCFMNPPYAEVDTWMAKAAAEVAEGRADLVACLVPARTDVAWWWDYAIGGEVRFLRGRLHFSRESGTGPAPFASAVVILGRPATVVWWSAWPTAAEPDA